MVHALSTASLVFASFFALSRALTCNEGFNMTINSVPLFFWHQRQCVGDSKCIGQQFDFDVTVSGKTLTAAMRYGACMSSAYANYMDCENLFGKDSKFDPANLLDIIPGVGNSMNHAAQTFAQNTAASLKQLLSDGTGIKSFVDGAYMFYENLGFDFSKAVPLKPSIVGMLTALIDGQPSAIKESVDNFIAEFAELDTANPEFAAAIRTLLTNLGLNIPLQVDNVPSYKALIDRGPGLFKSVFPSDWRTELWYDVAFKLAGDVNPANWTLTTENMVSTIKTSYDIPADVGEYVNPILDSMPDLARGSQKNPLYVGRWSLDLLKKFSEEDAATIAFSSALIKMIEGFPGVQPLQYEYTATIKWLPGLFYKLFPGDKTIIQNVYTKMADGFNSFNSNEMTSSASDTKLSMMIKNLAATFTGSQAQIPNKKMFDSLVTSFSHMFYELMKVSGDYTKYIDDFSTIIDDEFKKWPNINAGDMISNLITAMGGDVPPELKPMLENLQPIIKVFITTPLNPNNLLNSFYDVTDSYKRAFPDSPFPDLVKQYIDIIFKLVTIPPATTYEQYMANQKKVNELNLEMMYWNIDFQFAIIKSFDYTTDELYKMVIKAWPDYGLYIHVMKAMDPADVKEMMKSIIAYFNTPPPHTTQGFVDAVKPSFQKITKSIDSFMAAVRQSFSPSGCKFGSCDSDLCNTQEYISAQTHRKRSQSALAWPTPTTSTTSDAQKISHRIPLYVASVWLFAKLFTN